MGAWPKIIRDPVHNIISFENTAEDKLLLDLINCREFQRLRRIKQLGLSELVFPGANHSRFAHSIGVMQTTRSFLRRIEDAKEEALNDKQKIFLLCAALLHDVGHGPFSHAFEKVTKDDHERRTLEIIQDDSTEVCKRLKEYDADFPQQLGAFFDKDTENEPEDASTSELPAPLTNAAIPIPDYLTTIVSSQMDADRFDYLLRDSLCTGTSYGRFDLPWLFQHLHIDRNKKRFFLSAKGIQAGEGYIFARYHMYRAVYFHKATRAAEVMLALIFKRLSSIISTEGMEKVSKSFPSIPRAILNAFSGSISLHDYLALDDARVLEFFQGASECSDPLLKKLGEGLLHRRLFKSIDTTDFPQDRVADFVSKARAVISAKGMDPDFAFQSDTPSDTPYKPYNPDAEKPAEQIYVQRKDGAIVEIGTVLDTLAPLRKKYQLTRYYFPEEIRSDIEKLAQQELHI